MAFLTSPVLSEGLRLYLSETPSVALSSQTSRAPLVNSSPHQTGVAQSSTHGAGVVTAYQSSSDPRGLCGVVGLDDSQDMESEVALSEGDLENLNVTITQDESQSSTSREGSVAAEGVDSTQSSLDALLGMPGGSPTTEAPPNSQSQSSLGDHSGRSSLDSIQASLPSSLTDLAKALGTGPFDNPNPHFQESNGERQGASLGLYNPFDSAG